MRFGRLHLALRHGDLAMQEFPVHHHVLALRQELPGLGKPLEGDIELGLQLVQDAKSVLHVAECHGIKTL